MKKNFALMTKEELLAEHFRVLALHLIEPDPGEFFTEPFTLLELKARMEQVAGIEFDRDTFRRRMTPMLKEVGMQAPPYTGRPARVYVKEVK